MAKLESDKFTFEIETTNIWKLSGRWNEIFYAFYLTWNNEKIFNPLILKEKSNPKLEPKYSDAILGWGDFNEDEEPRLNSKIKKAIKEDEPSIWEPLDPDIVFGIYPNMYFPFLKSDFERRNRYKDILESKNILIRYEEDRKKLEDKKAIVEEHGGILPDDPFTIVLAVNTYNFKGVKTYSLQNSISLNMTVSRSKMGDFLKDLESDYIDALNNKLILS